MACFNLPNGGIACTRGKRRIDPKALERDLEIIAQFKRELGAKSMASTANKADYVRSEARKGAGNHHCHWPGCGKSVPPAMWGCKAHWFKLPPNLRARIWRTYRPGQEVNKTPSKEYLIAAQEVQEWIAAQGMGATPPQPSTDGV